MNRKEQEPTTKNDLGVECISRDSAIKALDYDIESFEFKSGVSKHMDDIAKLLNTIYEIQVNNIKALPSVTPQEQRTEWEQDHAILKAYSDGGNEALDKIRAEIEEHAKINQNLDTDRARALCWCLDVIDKYMGESKG